MTDSIYDPVNDDDNSDGVIDLDEAFGEDGTDIIETSYSPPEKPRGMDKFGTTLEEEMRGETLEQRIAQEEPDPNMEVDLVEGEPPVRAGEGGDVPDGIDTGSGEAPDSIFDEGVLDDGEVGEARAGRLVAPDEGAHEDEESDLLASDVGIDEGAASAEEAAMHIVDSEESSIDEGSTR